MDRDDLPDKGSAHWVETIRQIRELCPGVTIEVLIPDFDGQAELIAPILQERPEVVAHNMETVRRLTPVDVYKRQVLGYLCHGMIKQYLFGPKTVIIGLVIGGLFMIFAEKKRDVYKRQDLFQPP